MALVILATVPITIGAKDQPAKPQFGVAVDAVAVDVLVTDRKGPVRGLGARDFVVLDNGVPQRVEVVTADQLPVHVSLVLDTSQSVSGPNLAVLRRAAEALLRRLAPADRVNLLTLSDVVALEVPMNATSREAIAGLRHLEASGGTRLFDAIWTTLALFRSGVAETRRTMVVLFSDGRDTMSWLTSGDTHRMALESEAVIFAVTVPRPARAAGEPVSWAQAAEVPNHDFLGTLTDATGGRLIVVKKDADLVSAFEQSLFEMRNRYVLYYRPTGVEGRGFHKLEVKLARRSATVRARRGYYVP